MGLAVIVILLALGIFFITKFTLIKTGPSEAQTFQQKQLSGAFVNTLLNSNIVCGRSTVTFTRMVQDMENPSSSLLECVPLKDYFESSVRQILNRTLDEWHYKYDFSIIYPSAAVDAVNININKDCPQTAEFETYNQPIPSDYGTAILVKMRICT